MASRTIATIFTLKDKVSPSLQKMTKEQKNLITQAKIATNTLNKFADKTRRSFEQAAARTTKFAAIAGGALTAMAAKNGLSEAMNLEGYRMQLETATKDTQKAASVMQYAIKLANKTPFEGGAMVEAAAKFEAMGLNAKAYLPLAGDMAAATNKSLDQAAEAIIDAQTGELERLKEFGIKKDLIREQADKMFKKGTTINNKGQIAKQVQFNKALEAIMVERFKGGMDKQSKTLKGTMSTITGITKSALASMLGITDQGTLRAGSLYERLQQKVSSLAKTFEKWQSDGTFERLGATITRIADTGFRVLGGAIKFVTDNMWWLLPVTSGLVGTLTAMSILNTVTKWYKAYQAVITTVKAIQAALNLTTLAFPGVLLIAIIGGVIAIIVALAMHWDKVTAAVKKAWDWFKNLIKGMPDVVLALGGPIAPILLMIKHFDKVKEVAGKAIDKLKEFFGIKDKGTKEGKSSTAFEGVTAGMPKFAKGGIATRPSIFGDGPEHEIAIPLNQSPRSKKLLRQAQSIIGGGGANVHITIPKLADQIVVRSDADIDRIANQVAERFTRVAMNM